MDTLRYILYARKSSEDAERQSLSVPAQIRKIKEIFPDMRIIAVREESQSAFEPGRPVLGEVMGQIRSGKADGIVAWHPDRLSRNEIDAAAITYAIRRGVIKDLKFGSYFFVNSPDGIMMLQTMMSQSQYYSAKLSVDVKRGNEEQRKRGWLTYRPMPGYLNARNPANPDQGMIVIDPDRYALVRKMWDMLLTGAYSVPLIQVTANEDWHYRSPKRRRSGGAPIHRNSLYNMFTNIRYAGLIPIPGEPGEYERAAYPAMITVAEFDRAQQILGDRGKPRRSVSRSFAYRGLLSCKDCGCQVTAEQKLKSLKNGTVLRYVYYHCTHQRPCGNRKVVEEDDLVDQLYAIVDSYSIGPLLEEWSVESLRDMNADAALEREAIAGAEANALEQLREQYDRLVDMASKGLIDEDTFKAKSSLLLKQTKELENSLTGGSDRAAILEAAMRKTIDVIAHGHERFEDDGLVGKRDVLLALGSNPALADGMVEITPYVWLEPIRDGLPSLKADLDEVRTSAQQMSDNKLTDKLNSLKSKWLAILGEARTLLEQSPEAAEYAARPLSDVSDGLGKAATARTATGRA